ncbi:class A beta-lactamase, subclass A2 [Sphingobacterium sp. BIGb0165]|uniref:class A beta-lactamase, subclass A2 n=1 Tax=Sphingobacterium sp. BIGb0165 TaxID=2940615 RepID=UPI00216A0AF0|nr:class A beta-lactamase, subclass A2 [Sphingobacterium sp. BIGb0165]MCS4225938.1 beta-lactamase class A [Sphingobacterium sp. BIGb0165]
MKNIFLIFTLMVINVQLKAQSTQQLKKQLQEIIAQKNATVGISIKGITDKDTLSINGNLKMPMMSVFKFHIALAALNQVDKGKLKIDRKFFIRKDELLENTWSPMRDDYPNGNIYLTLDQLLRYTVSHSDNNGCDILLNILGGPEKVQDFITQQGIKDVTIKVNEQQMATWDNLYINTTTPIATTLLLEKFYQGKILKKETSTYLYQIMVETSRGTTWMKAGLPQGTELAHRTGISNTNEQNLRAAMNDIGIVKLANGHHFTLSIYLMNITEKREDSEKLIADITKATWKYFTDK